MRAFAAAVVPVKVAEHRRFWPDSSTDQVVLMPAVMGTVVPMQLVPVKVVLMVPSLTMRVMDFAPLATVFVTAPFSAMISLVVLITASFRCVFVS